MHLSHFGWLQSTCGARHWPRPLTWAKVIWQRLAVTLGHKSHIICATPPGYRHSYITHTSCHAITQGTRISLLSAHAYLHIVRWKGRRINLWTSSSIVGSNIRYTNHQSLRVSGQLMSELYILELTQYSRYLSDYDSGYFMFNLTV